jgi:hypothetical protein
MSKFIYNFRKSLSLFLLSIALRIKNHGLCALILWFNIRKLKKIKFKNKNTKKILIFSKSGGNEDLRESLQNNKNNNIIFFWIPRSFLKKIFAYHFKNKIYKDYFTKITNTSEINKKKLYVKFLTSTFNSLNKFLKLDGFISFNIFYYAEKYFDEVCRNLNKKFIILHKESTFTPIEEVGAVNVYKNYNEKTSSHKISVYSEIQKKILVKSKIANNNQIVVNGCPRSDYAFRLRKIKPKKNVIVYYMIESNRGSDLISNKSKINWTKLYDQTLQYLIEYAKNNSNIEVILKGKTGVHKNNHFSSKFLPKNCTFIDGGTGEKLLKDAKVVIAFNSTAVLEAIASNRNLIIPNFNNEKEKKKNFLYKITIKKCFTNSRVQFYKKINFYLKANYQNKKLSPVEKRVLNYYLGNTDGKSGNKMRNFLYKIIN